MSQVDLVTLKNAAKRRIHDLVEDYKQVIATGKKGSFNEERVKIAYVIPFLESLGWNPRTEEVLPEQATLTGRADFGLRVRGRTKIFLEMKSFSKSLDGFYTVKGKHRSFAEQAIHYAWGMKADWAILTNFEEIRLYDSRVRKPHEGLVWKKPIKFMEYESRFDELWLISKHSVVSGALDAFKAKVSRPPVDEAFLGDLMNCRQILAEDIRINNNGLTSDQINENVQKILDRLIFIKNCEDRLIIPAESLWKRYKAWQETAIDPDIIPFMMDLKNLFRYFNQVYNGKLFERHPCENLKISNGVLEEIINTLYGDGQHLGYNFSIIPVDVLGQAYELYLGSIIKEKEGRAKAIEIVKKATKRKAHGVYYTPEHIVNFIATNTLGILLENCKKPEDVSKIKVLDLACGSGSFLIKAFDLVKYWYKNYNRINQPMALPNTLDAHLVHEPNVEEKILTENLFGVDLDPQAVDITILNLSLKSIMPKKKLAYMGDHVKCGNSLVSGYPSDLKIYFEKPEEKRPFNWSKEFGNIVDRGGFDVIIGNPPYINMENLPEYQEYCKVHYPEIYSGKNDIHYYFIAKGLELLKENGFLGYITSRYFMEATFAKKLRKFIQNNACIKLIIDFGNVQIFDGVNVLTSIIILQKKSSKQERENNKIKVILAKKTGSNAVDLLEDIVAHIEEETFKDDQLDIFYVKQSELTEDSWKILPEKTKSILSKMETLSFKLEDFFEIEQSQKTGLNEAFVVNEAYANQMGLKRDLLRKVIKNSDILRYYIDWKQKFLIYTTDETLIDDYPEIKAHLEKYKKKLELRSECKTGLYKWYRLQRPRRERLFSSPEKIIVPFLSTENRFALDEVGYYGTADTYIMGPTKKSTVDIRYVLALLNSKLLEFYHKNTAKLKRGEYYEYLRKPLSSMPIRRIDFMNPLEKKRHDEIQALVREISAIKAKYYETLHLFDRLLENLIDSKTRFVSFRKDYYELGSQYCIDLLETKKLIADSIEGILTEIQVEERDDFLVLSAKYSTPDEQETFQRVAKIRFSSNEMKKFFFFSIKSFLMKNYKKRNWGKGPILGKVLDSLKIPKFVTNIELNKEKIERLVTEFLKSPQNRDVNLSSLEARSQQIEELINDRVFELYELSQEEIRLVNSFIEKQKKFVSKTI